MLLTILETYRFSSNIARARPEMPLKGCVNLPVSEGYQSAKKALEENFGLPHVIATHVKKLEHLPPFRPELGQHC